MARIRYLKPDFFKDEDLAHFPFEVRLFYAGLWCQADKAGRLEDRPMRIKVEIFPYDNVDVEKCLALLSKTKDGSKRPFINRYATDGQRYIQIVKWEDHQRPHHTEKASKIPPAPPKGEGNGDGKGEGNGDGDGKAAQSECEVKEPIPNVPLTVKEDEKPIKKPKTKKFIKPTPQEVEDYAILIGFPLNGQYFCDSNEAKGWLVGKNQTPMKDWQAVIRTWKRNEEQNAGRTQGSSGLHQGNRGDEAITDYLQVGTR